MIKWAAIAIGAVAAACAVRAQPAPTATIRVTEAVISPDGRSVAFTRSRSSAGGEAPSLWQIPYAGGEPAQLVAGRFAAQLRWSRDNRHIGFVISGEPGRVLMVPAAGGTVVAATAADTFVPPSARNPGEAPPIVEAKVLYLDVVGAGQQSITLTNGRETWIDLLTPATGARVNVMPPGIATIVAAPSWSADGTRFVVVGQNSDHGPEVFAGALRPAPSGRPDVVGAPPPPIRRLTFSNP